MVMDTAKLEAIYKKTQDQLKGWLREESFQSFCKILEAQEADDVKGDILEIGCFHGQSACILGTALREDEKLHICDPFDSKQADSNVHNWRSNPQRPVTLKPPSARVFAMNVDQIAGSDVEQKLVIHKCSSEDLRLPDKQKFRIVHVDGRHDYDFAFADIMFAMQHLVSGGVIIVDDWRSWQWPEVGQAVSNLLQSFQNMKVLGADRYKIYLMPQATGTAKIELQLQLSAIGTQNKGGHRSGWPHVMQGLKQLHHEGGLIFDDFVERTLGKAKSPKPWRKPWVGVFHHPRDVPSWYAQDDAPAVIFKTEAFKQSLPGLRAGIALSEWHARWLQQQLKVPVLSVKHPTETPELKFTADAWLANKQKKIVQVGWYLRNTRAIHQVTAPAGITKVHLRQQAHWVTRALKRIDAHSPFRHRHTQGNVQVMPEVSPIAYDTLLSQNAVFIELFSSSANNAVIECIVRNTPLIINRQPAVEEYLGKDYPLFYEKLPEATRLMTDEKILAGHEYLRKMDKTELEIGHFVGKIKDFLATLGWAW